MPSAELDSPAKERSCQMQVANFVDRPGRAFCDVAVANVVQAGSELLRSAE